MFFSVRARAITCFAQCLMSRDEHVVDIVKEIITPQTHSAQPPPRLIRTPANTLLGK